MTAAFVGSIPTSPVSTMITQSAKISEKNLLDGDEDITATDWHFDIGARDMCDLCREIVDVKTGTIIS